MSLSAVFKYTAKQAVDCRNMVITVYLKYTVKVWHTRTTVWLLKNYSQRILTYYTRILLLDLTYGRMHSMHLGRVSTAHRTAPTATITATPHIDLLSTCLAAEVHRQQSTTTYTPCLKKTSHLWLAIQSWHTRFDYDNFWHKYYRESRQSKYTLLSQLT